MRRARFGFDRHTDSATRVIFFLEGFANRARPGLAVSTEKRAIFVFRFSEG
jgi:hypothetical protein